MDPRKALMELADAASLRAVVSGVQSVLAAEGFDLGAVDGVIGERTRGAWARWQARGVPLADRPGVETRRIWPMRVEDTPNKGGRLDPLGVVLHHTAGFLEGDIAWIKNPASKVSYHVIIAQDGGRVRLVAEDRQAWHAGQSAFRGRSGCNQFMLGLAFTGNTVTGERRPHPELTAAEVESAVDLIKAWQLRFRFGLEWVTSHRIVSPGRKDDVSGFALGQVLEGLA